MKKIASFTVNHIDLLPGIYTSRVDFIGSQAVTTYDIRMKAPNREPVLQNAEMHTMEHLGATFLRNHSVFSNDVIYFGPMGCRTGFYLILKDERSSKEIAPLVTELFEFMANFEDEVPGASARDCGNYLDMNLPMARWEAKKFTEEILKNLTDSNLNYPH